MVHLSSGENTISSLKKLMLPSASTVISAGGLPPCHLPALGKFSRVGVGVGVRVGVGVGGKGVGVGDGVGPARRSRWSSKASDSSKVDKSTLSGENSAVGDGIRVLAAVGVGSSTGITVGVNVGIAGTGVGVVVGGIGVRVAVAGAGVGVAVGGIGV
jgi:hypothetical protein